MQFLEHGSSKAVHILSVRALDSFEGHRFLSSFHNKYMMSIVWIASCMHQKIKIKNTKFLIQQRILCSGDDYDVL